MYISIILHLCHLAQPVVIHCLPNKPPSALNMSITIHMKTLIQSLLNQAVSNLAPENQEVHNLSINIERPRDIQHGDFSSNLALTLTQTLKTPPRLLAEQIIKHIPAHESIASITVAGPGFINFTLSHDELIRQFKHMWTSSTAGVVKAEVPETVVVDYSSPNLAKEMHVGHLRSTIIGDALGRVLELKGMQVIRQNHVGDWGTQFGMLLAQLDDDEKQQPDSLRQLSDLETFYKKAKQRFDNDPLFAQKAREWVVLLQSGDAQCLTYWHEFIQLSLAHCQTLYTRLHVLLTPADVCAESFYNNMLPEIVTTLREKKLLEECEGAQCVFLAEFKGKNDERLPIIVQKKDGGFLYASTDLAAVAYRQHTLHANRVLYVVDARQALHFQQIFALAHQAGFAHDSLKLEHVPFGMVLDKLGKPYKSRDGGVTKLSDLLDEAVKRAHELILSTSELNHMAQVLGISSIKYADLSKNRITDYVFDFDTMLSFDGNTAPYLLYAYTRTQSLLTKSGADVSQLLDADLVLEHPTEIRLIKQLILFPEVIDSVSAKSAPHLLCTYIYELAGLFSTFYEACPILNQANPHLKQSRLCISALTARLLKLGLSLLGIPTLMKM